jgi:hypothetical protein
MPILRFRVPLAEQIKESKNMFNPNVIKGLVKKVQDSLSGDDDGK